MIPSEIYFAAGCFWGTEKLFQCIRGVIDTECGYANGNLEILPDYQKVCAGDTGYRETVRVQYDAQTVTLPQLLKAFFYVVDPTVENRQGNDIGTQYQTGIYYTDDVSGEIIRAYAQKEALHHPRFCVEIAPLSVFHNAEDYHQDYLIKNPEGYCHISPREFSHIQEIVDSEQNR